MSVGIFAAGYEKIRRAHAPGEILDTAARESERFIESAHEFEYFTAHYHDGRRRDVQKTGLAREGTGTAVVKRLHLGDAPITQIRQRLGTSGSAEPRHGHAQPRQTPERIHQPRQHAVRKLRVIANDRNSVGRRATQRAVQSRRELRVEIVGHEMHPRMHFELAFRRRCTGCVHSERRSIISLAE